MFSKRKVCPFPAGTNASWVSLSLMENPRGASFYSILLLFFIGGVAGDLAETIFCRLKMGWWMSRSSVVWGPFSIVWGLALAAATLFLYKYRGISKAVEGGPGQRRMEHTYRKGGELNVCTVFKDFETCWSI